MIIEKPKPIRTRPTTEEQADSLYHAFQMLCAGCSAAEISAASGLSKPLIEALQERFQGE